MVPKTEIEDEPKKILVVEDDILIRMLIADELRDLGFQVVEARSGDDAVGYLESGSHVDLIFSDVQMPGTVDGVQLARRVRVALPKLPVILTSGDGQPPDIGGALHFVPKPYEIFHVVALVLRSLGLVGGDDAP
ncbi:response regulator [Acidocella sp.]|uniref:response regulator n=1 Tax=Acidocella sp. TaxID=50710 RepID=UPI0026139A1A|nr:response regulator [Acidocella sp.]MDD2794653.1 response regulator [Acidocella sp.]